MAGLVVVGGLVGLIGVDLGEEVVDEGGEGGRHVVVVVAVVVGG